MFRSCRFIKIEPRYAAILHEFMSKPRNKFIYKENGESLYVFIISVEEHELGKVIQLSYDELLTISVINPNTFEPEEQYVKRTIKPPIQILVFEKEPLENTIGILANKLQADKTKAILTDVIKRKSAHQSIKPLKDVRFLLYEKEGEISKIQDFADIKEVHIDEIVDMYIDAIQLKGTTLYATDEYEKYVKNPSTRGKIKSLAISFQDRIYYIIEDGRIFTTQAEGNNNDFFAFYNIFKRLFDINAITYD